MGYKSNRNFLKVGLHSGWNHLVCIKDNSYLYIQMESFPAQPVIQCTKKYACKTNN